MTDKEKSCEEFSKLLNIIDELRSKCPWDMKQTNESLRKLTIEETYELADAIFSGDDEGIRNELGDLMLHIVFYAKIGSEKNLFSMTGVLKGINEKLIYRHPHVFGEVEVSDASEVERNWEHLKIKENSGYKPVLSGVPSSLPAIIKANRIQVKSAFSPLVGPEKVDCGCRYTGSGFAETTLVKEHKTTRKSISKITCFMGIFIENK